MADKELEQGLEELESLKQTFKSKLNANDVSTSNVEFRNYPQLFDQLEKKLPTQTKVVNPTTAEQNVLADSGYKLIGVKVNAVVPSDYYKPEEVANVTPTTNAQVVTPTANAVFNQVNVSAVTSDIDENIQPENIKSGTTILGVTGTLEEGGGELAGYNVESIVSEDGASQTLKITSGFSANGNPIEVATDEEMANALTQANVGKVYKFTGTSSTYETDAIYIISEVE